jgi:hypothetical protein
MKELCNMSRPKPQVLLDFTDPKTYKSEQVLEASAIYAVFYKGKPINLRSLKNSLLNENSPKYKKVSFSNQGHAFNLAEKLNRLFKTTQFEVFKFTVGEKVTEE